MIFEKNANYLMSKARVSQRRSGEGHLILFLSMFSVDFSMFTPVLIRLVLIVLVLWSRVLLVPQLSTWFGCKNVARQPVAPQYALRIL